MDGVPSARGGHARDVTADQQWPRRPPGLPSKLFPTQSGPCCIYGKENAAAGVGVMGPATPSRGWRAEQAPMTTTQARWVDVVVVPPFAIGFMSVVAVQVWIHGCAAAEAGSPVHFPNVTSIHALFSCEIHSLPCPLDKFASLFLYPWSL